MDILGKRRTFTRKQISVRFNIINKDGSTDELILKDDYRMSCNIQQGGGESGSVASLQIEGLNQNAINRLSQIAGYSSVTSPTVMDQSNTLITIEAGIYNKSLSHVYTGYIQNAYAVYSLDGNVIFNILASSSNGLLSDINYFSMPGHIPISTILKRLSEICNTPIIDHGGWQKNQTLTNPAFKGTPLDMVIDVCHATGAIYHYVNLGGNVTNSATSSHMLHIWGPLFTEKDTTQDRPIISKETGLIGYPQFNANGIILDVIFNPRLTYYGGIIVKSSYIPQAWQLNQDGLNPNGQKILGNSNWDGLWLVKNLYHSLTSEVPNGEWKTTIECQRSDVAQVNL